MKELNREYLKIFFLFLGVISCFMLLSKNVACASGKIPTLRVGIFLNHDEANISGDGTFEVFNLKSGQLICREKGKTVKMVSHQKGIKISEFGVYSGPIKIIPVGNTKISVIINGQQYRYRGCIEIALSDHAGKINMINIINIEEYLYGVLKKEISPKWPFEALKSQAIAARTFAIYNRDKYIDKGYNLDSTTNSQAYGGVNHEDFMTNKAVDATFGKIITYKGEPINAVYHSDSGGYTANSEDVWGSYLPYLRGVKSGFEELVSPSHHHWEYTISESVLLQKIRNTGLKLELIRDITLLKDEKTGRVDKLGFDTGNGQTEYMTAKNFRTLIGFDIIRSTLFECDLTGRKVVKNSYSVERVDEKNINKESSVIEKLEQKEEWTIRELLELLKERKNEETEKEIEIEIIPEETEKIFKFYGMGNGHGVGMSQWGAYGMALQGYKYKDILSYYYQGIDIIKNY